MAYKNETTLPTRIELHVNFDGDIDFATFLIVSLM